MQSATPIGQHQLILRNSNVSTYASNALSNYQLVTAATSFSNLSSPQITYASNGLGWRNSNSLLSTNCNVNVNGTVSLSTVNCLQLGANTSGRQADAGKLAYGSLQ